MSDRLRGVLLQLTHNRCELEVFYSNSFELDVHHFFLLSLLLSFLVVVFTLRKVSSYFFALP